MKSTLIFSFLMPFLFWALVVAQQGGNQISSNNQCVPSQEQKEAQSKVLFFRPERLYHEFAFVKLAENANLEEVNDWLRSIKAEPLKSVITRLSVFSFDVKKSPVAINPGDPLHWILKSDEIAGSLQKLAEHPKVIWIIPQISLAEYSDTELPVPGDVIIRFKTDDINEIDKILLEKKIFLTGVWGRSEKNRTMLVHAKFDPDRVIEHVIQDLGSHPMVKWAESNRKLKIEPAGSK